MSNDLLYSILTAIVSCATTYGIIRTKVDRLESDHSHLSKKLDESLSKFVLHSHFDAVVNPLKESIKEIESDIKKILIIVSRHNENER